MVVYENNSITITYAPETDSILVAWPGTEPYTLPEIKESLHKLLEIITNYNAKNLVIDAMNAKVNVDYQEYLQVVKNTMYELNKTHLQKVARVLSADPEREAIQDAANQNFRFNFQFQNFKSRAEAVKWISKS